MFKARARYGFSSYYTSAKKLLPTNDSLADSPLIQGNKMANKFIAYNQMIISASHIFVSLLYTTTTTLYLPNFFRVQFLHGIWRPSSAENQFYNGGLSSSLLVFLHERSQCFSNVIDSIVVSLLAILSLPRHLICLCATEEIRLVNAFVRALRNGLGESFSRPFAHVHWELASSQARSINLVARSEARKMGPLTQL